MMFINKKKCRLVELVRHYSYIGTLKIEIGVVFLLY